MTGRLPQYRVYTNLNVYYHPTDPRPYVSPDAFAVKPAKDLGEDVTSYRIGPDGPAPSLIAEVLSQRSFQQRDLTDKVTLYALLKVAEYILVDPIGRFLPQRLLLKRLQPDGSWLDEQDEDSGVTSQFGFRLVFDTDGKLRVLNAATRAAYPRPQELERIPELEAEVARLRRLLDEKNRKD
jgi:Uma2 family endonuclease